MSAPVVIAGATGFLGSALHAHLRAAGREVRTIGRSFDSDAQFGKPDELRSVIDGASMLVNLAGRPVACRYTDANRDAILHSRIDTTEQLREAVADVASPPPLWCNASTATIYNHDSDRAAVETDPPTEIGFSEDVARAWETTFFEADLPNTRRVPLRISIVLGDGPATRILFRLAQLGAGGPQIDGPWFPHVRYRGIGVAKDDPAATTPSLGKGTGGKQRFSWIHIDDALRAIDHIEAHPEITGPVNFAAPGATTNAELMRVLRETVNMPLGLPAYRWMLEPAMWLLRNESELVLKSRWVAPGVLTDTGFSFDYPELGPAASAVWHSMHQRN